MLTQRSLILDYLPLQPFLLSLKVARMTCADVPGLAVLLVIAVSKVGVAAVVCGCGCCCAAYSKRVLPVHAPPPRRHPSVPAARSASRSRRMKFEVQRRGTRAHRAAVSENSAGT